MNNLFVDVNINQTNLFGVNEPIFEFTFLPYGGEEVDERFMIMTATIRNTLIQYYPYMDPDEDAVFAVEFIPTEDERFRRQHTFGRINSMTGHVFSEIFIGILQSDETIELDGMMITVQRLGGQLPQQYHGAGVCGWKNIPTAMKGQGLIAHPSEHEYQERMNRTGLCGIRACLLLKDPIYQARPQIERWLGEAERLGRVMNLGPGGNMGKEEFDLLVQQDGWKKYRIIVFSKNRSMQSISMGPEWYFKN